jgi:hypothetical protein
MFIVDMSDIVTNLVKPKREKNALCIDKHYYVLSIFSRGGWKDYIDLYFSISSGGFFWLRLNLDRPVALRMAPLTTSLIRDLCLYEIMRYTFPSYSLYPILEYWRP